MNCRICTPILESKNNYEIAFFKSQVLLAHCWLYPFEISKTMIRVSKFNGEFIHYRHQSIRLANVINDLEVHCGLVFDISFVPTIKEHKRQRGFDHAEILARHTARYANRKLVRLMSALHCESQVGKSKSQRILNPRFALKSPMASQNIILIDDLASTRSTLFHAGLALKNAGAQNIIGLTLGFNSDLKFNI